MKKLLYKIRIEHIKEKSMLKDEMLEYVRTEVDDGACKSSKRTDNSEDCLKWLRSQINFEKIIFAGLTCGSKKCLLKPGRR